MNVVVMGSGYVGLVTGTCLAEMGNLVTCIDSDHRRVAQLRLGIVPFYEPGLESLMQRNTQQRRLSFSSNAAGALEVADLVFIAVGTPQLENGSADTRQVMAAATEVARHVRPGCVIVNKSTSPVGTAETIRDLAGREFSRRGLSARPEVVSNPEFLREGAAISDFMRPDRVVIGTDDERCERVMRELYAPFVRNHERLIVMGLRDAELTKYAANAMLATRISFMNEIAGLCSAVGADVENIRRGVGSDSRIGYSYLYAGCGYGGSCFPKDVKALERAARDVGFDAKVLEAVETRNDAQKKVLFEKILARFDGDLQGRTIAVWGLAFKPNTDDMREASSRVLLEMLWAAGAKVQAYDPVAMDETVRIYGMRDDLCLCDQPEQALENADALAIVTEWKIFRSPDFDAFKRLKNPLIFDGRNIYDPLTMQQHGIEYYAIGRIAGR